MKCLFKGHLEECRDSGNETLSDSTAEERNKQKKIKELNLALKDDQKKSRKRKMKDMESESQTQYKKHKVDNITSMKVSNGVSEFQETETLDMGNHRHLSRSKEKNYFISQGSIIRNQSITDGVPKFVPFSNSFLHKLGCQFYFKDTGKVIKLLSYSERGENLQYKIKLICTKKKKSSTVKAALGQKINIAAYDFDSDVIDYELFVKLS